MIGTCILVFDIYRILVFYRIKPFCMGKISIIIMTRKLNARTVISL